MITDDINTSIKNALYKTDKNIILHVDKIAHTGFPFYLLTLKELKITPLESVFKKKIELSYELLYMKSKDNSISELISAQKTISDVLLPVINIKNKKITPDETVFYIKNNKLFFNFKLNFYIFEEDNSSDTMQILDLTLKGE